MPGHNMRLDNCHNFHDFRALARRKLPGPIFNYTTKVNVAQTDAPQTGTSGPPPIPDQEREEHNQKLEQELEGVAGHLFTRKIGRLRGIP
jgi:hypothetical protein